MIFGGKGFTRGGQGELVERFYRESIGGSILGGTEEVLNDLSIRMATKQYQLLSKL
jgi:acyl-CoA dehydrogenase